VASDLVKEARSASTASADKTCANGRSRKNKYSSSEKLRTGTENRATKKRSLCNGGG